MALTANPAQAAAAPPQRSVPFCLPDVGPEEIDAVTAVLRSRWLTTGPVAQAFEREFASYLGVTHAVALNSCTAALHLALEALGVRAGDEVLVPSVTFTSTAEVVEYLGARSRFVDVEPDTLNASPAAMHALIEREYRRVDGAWRHRDGGILRAIVPVHMAGHPCDMDGMLRLGRDYGLAVVDDAAHALPAWLDSRRIGALECPTAFSFYATKNLTTGEGGMLCTDDAALASRVRMMSLHGIGRDAWKRYSAEGSWYYEVLEAGYKYNLTDLAAAVGRVQLKKLEAMHAARERIAARYQQALRGVEQIELPAVRPGVRHAWHLFIIRLRLDRLRIDRARFMEALRAAGIGASVHFIPLHRQPYYARRYGYRPEDFPVSEVEYPRLISLPLYSAMSQEDMDAVVGAVVRIAATHGR